MKKIDLNNIALNALCTEWNELHRDRESMSLEDLCGLFNDFNQAIEDALFRRSLCADEIRRRADRKVDLSEYEAENIDLHADWIRDWPDEETY